MTSRSQAEGQLSHDTPWSMAAGERQQETATEVGQEAAAPEGTGSASSAAGQARADSTPASPASVASLTAPPLFLGRNPAEAFCSFLQGKITYYSQGLFACVCSVRGHQRCVLTRSSLPGRSPAQGRPLGFMERQAARLQLEGNPEAIRLLAMERAKRPDEGAEPEVQP